ncbi:hypothetical protein NDU88_004691 [Pleurodeles waltl]|uniref:Rx N-terminal domain-containing protein n=1 Tax=Pleurodeles waltl TaxID=8319 RepID=A0AAV7L2M4_PLEWA|nr:hypothetical protein NDU88_004691 [Pleurodeles waltl]
MDPQSDSPALVTVIQDILTHFLQEILSEIGSLKDDLKSCIKEVRHEVTEIGNWVDDLERTVDARSEDQEQLWRWVKALEKQNIELQSKQEDLENRSQHKTCASDEYRERQRGQKLWPSRLPFSTLSRMTLKASFPLSIAPQGDIHPRGPNAPTDIPMRVHYFTEKEAILAVACKSPTLTFQGDAPFICFKTSLPSLFTAENSSSQSWTICAAGVCAINGANRLLLSSTQAQKLLNLADTDPEAAPVGEGPSPGKPMKPPGRLLTLVERS